MEPGKNLATQNSLRAVPDVERTLVKASPSRSGIEQALSAFKLDNLRALLSEQEAERWHAVKHEVAQEVQIDRHRASADAKLLQLTLARIKQG